MMIRKLTLLFLLFILSGCVQNIRYHDIGVNEKIPSTSFEAYYYAEGNNDRSRAVFLKQPDVKIDMDVSSPAINPTTATYAEALYFMNQTRGLRVVDTMAVSYQGKPLGYLITYNTDRGRATEASQIIVELYEFRGKIRFNAKEKLESSQ